MTKYSKKDASHSSSECHSPIATPPITHYPLPPMSAANNIDLLEKYDRLLHISEETGLHRAEVVLQAKELFPAFSDIAIYDKVLGGYEIETYSQARGKGLSIEESAHVAEISAYVVKQSLLGNGLSLEKFVALAKAELFSKAVTINRLLALVEKALNATETSAALALLEKIEPRRYGKNAYIQSLEGEVGEGRVLLNFTLRDDEE